ncbi:phosphodiesterase [Feifania hominis]|uniref:Phosphoesterase n=1 Tax=Feifania hominis TaxID=2763660 RepID=A0A926DDE9_9FIRM|nr:phosphodiesterase [Feifania hominis]MBC8536068.1 phosphodiesterase [Feifania hominis]
MKLMIASDLHGSYYYAQRMRECYSREGAQRLLLLGDLLYHGPRNDLPRDYAPKQVIALLNEMKHELFCVRGNCDAEVDQMVLEFPILADYMLLFLGGRTVFVTHGHVHNEDALPPLQPGDVLLHGHTHLPEMRRVDGGVWYLNPGSLAIPKGGNPPSYMTWEDGLWQIKALDGQVLREGNLA